MKDRQPCEHPVKTGAAGYIGRIRKVLTALLTGMGNLLHILRENTALFAGRD